MPENKDSTCQREGCWGKDGICLDRIHELSGVSPQLVKFVVLFLCMDGNSRHGVFLQHDNPRRKPACSPLRLVVYLDQKVFQLVTARKAGLCYSNSVVSS